MTEREQATEIERWRRERRQHKKNYRHWLKTRKRGDRIACLYDGKQGRAVWGTVLRRKKDRLHVRMDELWTKLDNAPAEALFVDGGGWVAGGLMPLLGFIPKANRTGGSWYGLQPVAGERGSVVLGEYVLARELLPKVVPNDRT